MRPLVLIGLGLNVLNRRGVPARGPAVIAANHNSHLDAVVLMSLFSLKDLHRVRPVAAADYFLSNRILAWFALNVIGIIPLDRTGRSSLDDLFEMCRRALDRDEILLLFPEGSRGNPEQMGRIRKGIFYLLKGRTDTPITPVVMHGLGRALPRGEALFVPFNCDVVVGKTLWVEGNASDFTRQLSETYKELFEHCLTRQQAETS